VWGEVLPGVVHFVSDGSIIAGEGLTFTCLLHPLQLLLAFFLFVIREGDVGGDGLVGVLFDEVGLAMGDGEALQLRWERARHCLLLLLHRPPHQPLLQRLIIKLLGGVPFEVLDGGLV